MFVWLYLTIVHKFAVFCQPSSFVQLFTNFFITMYRNDTHTNASIECKKYMKKVFVFYCAPYEKKILLDCSTLSMAFFVVTFCPETGSYTGRNYSNKSNNTTFLHDVLPTTTKTKNVKKTIGILPRWCLGSNGRVP